MTGLQRLRSQRMKTRCTGNIYLSQERKLAPIREKKYFLVNLLERLILNVLNYYIVLNVKKTKLFKSSKSFGNESKFFNNNL